jgi:hypothetical protein
MPDASRTLSDKAEKRGRAAGYLVLGLLVTAFTAVCTVEIITQAWQEPENAPEISCRQGLSRLVRAHDRAREAALQEASGERAAVWAFRAALAPEWDHDAALGRRCARDPQNGAAFQEIEQLRYAEEHAVRYEATGLSRHRRRVSALKTTLGL